MQCKLCYADTANIVEYTNRDGQTVRVPQTFVVRMDVTALCAMIHATAQALRPRPVEDMPRVLEFGKALDTLCEAIIAAVADNDAKDAIKSASEIVNAFCGECGQYWPCSVVSSPKQYRGEIVAKHHINRE